MGLRGIAVLAVAGAASLAAVAAPAPAPAPLELDPLTVTGQPPPPVPVPKLRLNPPYPMSARHRWEEGCVVLRFTVRPDGKTDDFAILESNPPRIFEREVIMAVYRWQYEKSDVPRTVVEKFEFRNPRLASGPVYTVVGVHHDPAISADGRVSFTADLQMRGYRIPTCKSGDGADRSSRIR